MEEIYTICQHKTLIVITHWLSTREGCEKVVKLEKTHVVKIR